MPTAILDRRSDLLDAIADTLDIPPNLYEEAVLKYEDIGGWLAAEDSELKDHSPEIYPQGSFRLGTMVRPVFRSDEFDIDLVCQLQLEKDAVSKAELKEMVGKRLKKRPDIEEVLSESRRAWTLNYRSQFHMDVLSSIPNVERLPTGILLPDKELHYWQKSNPITYADWFYDRMKVIFAERRALVAEQLEASIEEVPIWTVRTPLQRVVQILKRHRDVYFQHDLGNRPVSIIITTLAARAYRNQSNILTALVDIVKAMPNGIEKRDDKWWVANPVEPDENFAERWNEYPKRREAFFAWMYRAYADFEHLRQESDLRKVARNLAPALGESTVSRAAGSLGIVVPNAAIVESASLRIVDAVPALGDSRHCETPRWPQNLRYSASMTGSVHRHIFEGRKLWDLTKRSVPKGVGLCFSLTTNVPPPYEVRWQIVNTGMEATSARQLRGNFEEGGAVRWEQTAFAGTHWVEGFVIKNGVCVARTGQKRVRVRG